jgi:hypothetical protein
MITEQQIRYAKNSNEVSRSWSRDFYCAMRLTMVKYQLLLCTSLVHSLRVTGSPLYMTENLTNETAQALFKSTNPLDDNFLTVAALLSYERFDFGMVYGNHLRANWIKTILERCPPKLVHLLLPLEKVAESKWFLDAYFRNAERHQNAILLPSMDYNLFIRLEVDILLNVLKTALRENYRIEHATLTKFILVHHGQDDRFFSDDLWQLYGVACLKGFNHWKRPLLTGLTRALLKQRDNFLVRLRVANIASLKYELDQSLLRLLDGQRPIDLAIQRWGNPTLGDLDEAFRILSDAIEYINDTDESMVGAFKFELAIRAKAQSVSCIDNYVLGLFVEYDPSKVSPLLVKTLFHHYSLSGYLQLLVTLPSEWYALLIDPGMSEKYLPYALMDESVRLAAWGRDILQLVPTKKQYTGMSPARSRLSWNITKVLSKNVIYTSLRTGWPHHWQPLNAYIIAWSTSAIATGNLIVIRNWALFNCKRDGLREIKTILLGRIVDAALNGVPLLRLHPRFINLAHYSYQIPPDVLTAAMITSCLPETDNQDENAFLELARWVPCILLRYRIPSSLYIFDNS